MDALDSAVAALARCERLLVFTGAGISTESGIPDFRGPDGVWTKVDPEEFTIDRYISRAETRISSWQRRNDSGFLGAIPNRAHHALVDLWDTGRMGGCVTQNIDGLHQMAGLPAQAVVELHGNARTTSCLDCGQRTATDAVVVRVEAGDADPACLVCGGILKVDVVFFGEDLPVGELARAHDLAEVADGVLVIGSSLSVFPAALIPLAVVEAGGPMVIVNQGATDFDSLAVATIDSPAGDAVPSIVAALR